MFFFFSDIGGCLLNVSVCIVVSPIVVAGFLMLWFVLWSFQLWRFVI